MNSRAFWQLVSDYGDLASIAGLLLSFVGFGLTISSALAARNAAERARQGVNQIKTQLTANELASCIGIIQDLLEELNKSHFTLAVQLCSNAALGLSRISTNREFTSEESTRLANAVDDLKLIYDKVEELRREKKRGQISKQAHSKLNEMVVTLGLI